MKKVLLGILIGGIVFGTIGAGAAYVYTARDIGYQPNDENWNVSNASEALNSLKTDISNMQNLANQGEMLYSSGTSIVGLVSDNSPYTDSNGNYVLASSSLGQSMIDNVTYKSIEAPSIVSGSAGSETVIPFNNDLVNIAVFDGVDLNGYNPNKNSIEVDISEFDYVYIALNSASYQDGGRTWVLLDDVLLAPKATNFRYFGFIDTKSVSKLYIHTENQNGGTKIYGSIMGYKSEPHQENINYNVYTKKDWSLN